VPCAEFEFDSVSDRPLLVRNPLNGIWHFLCVIVENDHAQRLIDNIPNVVTCALIFICRWAFKDQS
jgi:hypothetical protein